MRTLWKCSRQAILFLMAIGLMTWYGHSTFAQQKKLTDDVRRILLQGTHVDDPSKADQLRAYAQNSKNSMQSIENVLVTFLSPGLKKVSIKEDRMGYLLCSNAICSFNISFCLLRDSITYPSFSCSTSKVACPLA